MKLFLTFSIVCLTGVHCFLMNSADQVELQDDEKKMMAECARELNVDASKYSHAIDINEYSENPDEETTCMLACGVRKWITGKIAPESAGSNNKETLYNAFMKLIDEVYETGFGSIPIEYTRQDIVDKAKKCYASEPTECGFFKCVQVHKPPYAYVVAHYVIHAILHGIAES